MLRKPPVIAAAALALAALFLYGVAQLFILRCLRHQPFNIGFHRDSAIAHHDTNAQADPRAGWHR